jgi:hypothetical protein
MALGDADPVTFKRMEDINPGFIPRGSNVKPLSFNDTNRKGKGKAVVTIEKTGGIFDFFG